MKNKNFLESVKCALAGLHNGFVSEKNFRIYTVIGLAFLIFHLLLKADSYDYVIFISAEYMNTAVERAIDRLGEGVHEDFRFAKDVAAAAVLVSGIAFFLGEGIILISKLAG